MEKKKLYGLAELVKKEKTELRYYLTKEKDGKEKECYGFLIEVWDQDSLLENAEITFFTYSRELAETVLKKIIRCRITPLCLEEVVDDLLAQC